MTAVMERRRVRWRLPSPWRKAVLILHIVSGVGWIGVDFALLPLVITGLTTDDGASAAAAFRAVAMLVPWTIPALSLLILATGILLGLGSKWGLFRFWWVAIKLGISVLLTALVFVALLPAVNSIGFVDAASGDAVRAALGDPSMFLYPPVVSCSFLLAACVLSVAKPWGRIPSRRARA